MPEQAKGRQISENFLFGEHRTTVTAASPADSQNAPLWNISAWRSDK